MTSPHLFAIFLSPTGSGLKALFRVPASADAHPASFEAVEAHIHKLTGCGIDQACKDVARLCFVSFDAALYHNPDAKELPILIPLSLAGVAQTHRGTDSQTLRSSDSHDAQTHKSVSVAGGESIDSSWVLEFLPKEVHDTNP